MKDLQEESSKGKVKGSLFLTYFGVAGNIFFVIFVLLLFLLAEGKLNCKTTVFKIFIIGFYSRCYGCGLLRKLLGQSRRLQSRI